MKPVGGDGGNWIAPLVTLLVALGAAIVALLKRVYGSSITREEFAGAFATFEQRMDRKIEEVKETLVMLHEENRGRSDRGSGSGFSRVDQSLLRLTQRVEDIANRLK